jgi:hypothetical protein
MPEVSDLTEEDLSRLKPGQFLFEREPNQWFWRDQTEMVVGPYPTRVEAKQALIEHIETELL